MHDFSLFDFEILLPQSGHAMREEREANDRRERELWGDMIPDKRVLQRRGFGVWWHDREAGLIHVGGKVLTIDEFKEMAARHKRVSGIQ